MSPESIAYVGSRALGAGLLVVASCSILPRASHAYCFMQPPSKPVCREVGARCNLEIDRYLERERQYNECRRQEEDLRKALQKPWN